MLNKIISVHDNPTNSKIENHEIANIKILTECKSEMQKAAIILWPSQAHYEASIAIESKDIQEINKIISFDFVDIDAKLPSGDSLLTLAIKKKSLFSIMCLISKGADPGKKLEGYFSGIELAKHLNHDDKSICQYLEAVINNDYSTKNEIEKKVKNSAFSKYCDQSQDKLEQIYIDAVTAINEFEDVKLRQLLTKIDQIDAKIGSLGLTLLGAAVKSKNLSAVKILESRGADPDWPTYNGFTPKSLAKALGLQDIYDYLKSLPAK